MKRNDMPLASILGRLAALVPALTITSVAAGDDFVLPYYTLDGGSFRCSAGPFVVIGTVGQPDASPALSAGEFVLLGGHWGVGGSILVAAPPLDQPAPSAHRLHRAVPNPFNPRTSIRIELPREERVALRVYDASGRLVSTLLDGRLEAGRFAVPWDGTDDAGTMAASGVYFVVLETDTFRESERLILLK